MGLEKVFMPFSSWKIVLLSFLGASTFWFFSALGKQYNTRIKHPINVVFDEDSLVLMKPIVGNLELDVSGGGWDLFRQGFWFGSDPIVIEPDNPVSIKFLTRPTLLPIVSDHLKQFQINFLYTDTIHIDINRKISRRVVLEVDSSKISLEDGFRIISPIKIEPDTIRVFGPTSFIDTLTSRYTVPIESQEIDRNFDRFLSLGLPEGYSISSDPSTVNVTFEIDRFDRLRMQVPLEKLNFPEDSSAYLEEENVTVSFTIQRALRQDFFAEDFKVIIDFDMLEKADSTAPIFPMIFPENALEVEVSPDSLKVLYRE
jgi:hypothetical protein